MRQRRGGDESVLVVGDDIVGTVVSRNLPDDVLLFGFDETATRRVSGGVSGTDVISDVGQLSPPEHIEHAVVATADDGTNLLAAQRLRLESDATVLARVNDPARRRAFADLGIETVCTTTMVGEELANEYARLVDTD